MASDPLFSPTSISRPVDFHSFRRAFATALAKAGVNAQQAMHLASHSDAKVHATYVMRTTAMKQIPAAAVPQLDAATLGVLVRPIAFSKRARSKTSTVSVRPDRFERTT